MRGRLVETLSSRSDVHAVAQTLHVQALDINASGVASTSRGLVGDTVFAVLPNIKPIHTFVVTLAFQMVSRCACGD